jgi:hypothetical protein
MYSKRINEALERYGARTHGSLERRVKRLQRFIDATNKKYAEELRLENEKFQEVNVPILPKWIREH